MNWKTLNLIAIDTIIIGVVLGSIFNFIGFKGYNAGYIVGAVMMMFYFTIINLTKYETKYST